MKVILIGILGTLAVGCSDTSGVQTITGRVAQDSFGAQVASVVVTHNGSIVSEAPVAADGSFTVGVARGTGYTLRFHTAAERVALISPRATGTIDTTFAVRSPATAFDLGLVRKIDQPLSTTYHYGNGDSDGQEGDGECEDGVDQNGAVCVDDDAENGQTCQGDDGDGETNDDGVDQGDGDGETNDDGADQGDGDGETDDDTDVAQAAAIAEHNLPSQIGCGAGDGETNDDGETEGDGED
jgi:hypothetical protein